MTSGSMALLWLLAGATPMPVTDPAPDLVVYPAEAARPFASATLLVDATTYSVKILNQHNIVLNVVPAEYQDLQITRSFAFQGLFSQPYHLTRIGATVDSKYHFVPLDLLEYKEFNPSYIKFEISASFFRNRAEQFGPGPHRIYVDFFTDGKPASPLFPLSLIPLF
jgi:hypothetical protein